MRYRPSFWFVSSAAMLISLILALRWRDLADAPPAPPPLTAAEGAALAQAAPVNPTQVIKLTPASGRAAGTAVSIADGGAWLTARSVVAGCAKAAIVIGAGEGIAARPRGDLHAPVVVLTTHGGAPALPLAAEPPHVADLDVAAGFAAGRPAEVAMRDLGPARRTALRAQSVVSTEALAETGRTEGLGGALAGLVGAPVLDGSGRIVGLLLANAPRRGRFYAAPLAELRQALAAAHIPAAASAAGPSITEDNYGLAADDLRRALRVAPVICIR